MAILTYETATMMLRRKPQTPVETQTGQECLSFLKKGGWPIKTIEIDIMRPLSQDERLFWAAIG